MDSQSLFNGQYQNKTVLLTGHTGFKGSWLAHWLHQLGATVVGYSLPAPTDPSHWLLMNLPITQYTADIRDRPTLRQVMTCHQPDVVFHLAAQPLVRQSYHDPVETIETNVMGTVNVLECVRHTPSVRAVVIVTSDKCYENPEDGHPLTETDPMGGFDPYSMSKGAAELVTNSYRNSFFPVASYGQRHQTLIASGRAGNVIGGGDWAADRLLPDLIRSTQSNASVVIRNPVAVRPWQHVLEPLSGYLLLGQRLMNGDVTASGGWNFGPDTSDVLPVRTVVEQAQQNWPLIDSYEEPSDAQPHEARLLSLDCTRAKQQIEWIPVWPVGIAITHTVAWYRAFYQDGQVRTYQDLIAYIQAARAARLIWTQ